MGKQDFTLVNDTGFPIYKVFVSPADDNSWEDDVLGKDVLPEDAHVDIHFSHRAHADLWDLKVVDADGDEYVWEDFDLTTISKITIQWDGENTSASWE